MIIFPIFQILCAIGFLAMFIACWIMGVIGIFKANQEVPIRSLNAYSAQGLEDTNKRFQVLRDLETTPGGLRLDWCLKRLTVFGIIGVLSLGIEALIIATTTLERVSF